MRLLPADPRSGVVFVRRDAGNVEIPATLAHATQSFYATVIEQECVTRCIDVPVVDHADDLADAEDGYAVVTGTLARHPLPSGSAEGTVLALDGDAVLWVSYAEPPGDLASHLDTRVRVAARLHDGPPPGPPPGGAAVIVAGWHVSELGVPAPVAESSP